ncbi:MAG: amidohydrolase [Clostridia bacterium]|nr:amidohydrolase [Clostridia bacterium]
MKKLDIHTHVTLYPDIIPPRKADMQRFLSVDEQIKLFDDVNTAKGVLLPIVSPECQWENVSNQEAKIIADSNPDRFVWFCNVDPRSGENCENTDLEHAIGFYKELGARGVGEITASLYADDPMMDNLFGACESLDMPALIHIAPQCRAHYGIIDELGLPRIEKMLKKHPDLKLIGHSASFWCEISGDVTDKVRMAYPQGKVTEGRLHCLMREYGNLYCDLSAGSGANALMRDPEYAAKFLEEFSDRICYGTDVCSTEQTFHLDFDKFLTKMVSDKMLTKENYEKIVYKNAAKLIGLDK